MEPLTGLTLARGTLARHASLGQGIRADPSGYRLPRQNGGNVGVGGWRCPPRPKTPGGAYRSLADSLHDETIWFAPGALPCREDEITTGSPGPLRGNECAGTPYMACMRACSY